MILLIQLFRNANLFIFPQVSDGHFVYFFAPSNLSPLPKNIVFVIDVSGSMWGVKMKQVSNSCLLFGQHLVHFGSSCSIFIPLPSFVKHCNPVAFFQNTFKPKLLSQTVQAMKAILDDLTIDDNFSIIDFNHNVRCWSEELVPGSSIQIADAKRYIENIKPNGGMTQ